MQAIMIAVLTLMFPLQSAFAVDHILVRGNAHVCSKNATVLKSQNSHVATQVIFINKTNSSIYTYWIDFKGDPVLYSEVESGSSVAQPTYVTHPWIIIRNDMQCLGPFMPKRTMTTVVVD